MHIDRTLIMSKTRCCSSDRNLFYTFARIFGSAAARRGGVRLHAQHQRGQHKMAAQQRGPDAHGAHQQQQQTGR